MKKIALLILFIYLTGCASQRHSSRGWDHIKNRNYNQALIEFKTAQKSKDIPGTYLGIYRSHMGLGNKALAVDSLNKGLKKYPNDGFLNWAMADFLNKIKNKPCSALPYLYKTKKSRVGRGSAAEMLDADIKKTRQKCKK